MLGPLCSVGASAAGASPIYAPGMPLQHTKQPIVTGTSVLAVKYKDGVMMACDTLGSYGTLAKYKDLRRIKKANSKTLIGAGGEYSDFQYLMELLGELEQDDENVDDGFSYSPAEVFSYLRTVLYNRRSKMNPLWNNLVVAGCVRARLAPPSCAARRGRSGGRSIGRAESSDRECRLTSRSRARRRRPLRT
jgi:20S proteasome alpha/beta subunit